MGRTGVRSEWRDVPASVRHGIDELLGSPVVATGGVVGGFSPGPAVRAELADGRTVFVKAAGTALNPRSPGMHRREGVVLGGLPPAVPAPRLLGVVDDGDWVALAIEWVDGRMPVARDAADVARLLGVLDRVAGATAGIVMPGLLPFAEAHRSLGGHWIRLADAGPLGDVLVDWPAAALGAPWIDLVALLPALHHDGGPPPADVLAAHPLARRADPQAIDAFLASITGYFVRQSLLPPPPGLPTLRAFQAAQGAVARDWLAGRLRLA